MAQSQTKAKFIAFEGLDGSGQSTQANLLKRFLESQGETALLTKEPTFDSEAGKIIRKVLDKQETRTPQEFQELFAQDRKAHVNSVILPALEKGIWVITDRYFFSSMAYGAAAGVDLEWIIQRNNEFLLPDITFLLNTPPAVCIERIQKRGELQTLFERIERLKKVWSIYESLPNRFHNIITIQGDQPIETATKDIREALVSQLNLR